MTSKQVIAGLVLAAAAAGAHADTVLAESFDDVAGLTGAGWVQVNRSTAPLGTGWFQGNSGIFAAASGAADAYAAANFLGTGNTTGAISNWLFTPVLTLDGSSVVSFLARTAGEGFLDRIEVRFSGNGASTDVGSTTTSLGDFSTLLGSFQASSATGWVGLSYTLAGLDTSTTGRLAFRYVVDNVATAGNYIGIDDVAVTAVPEPATYGLMGLGVAALLLRRRFTA
ncbi:MAG: choice-of-anchor J domain-containing protein [Rubrivivax sp.]|nr:choice-of-anchor J domain-containing protein [Rubrivivax sp.]